MVLVSMMAPMITNSPPHEVHLLTSTLKVFARSFERFPFFTFFISVPSLVSVSFLYWKPFFISGFRMISFL